MAVDRSHVPPDIVALDVSANHWEHVGGGIRPSGPLQPWLDEAGISDFYFAPRAISPYGRSRIRIMIHFYNPSDAMLYKLTWY